jgi:acyl-CoA synthetase (AMP-forming)/AMP-acid ligase II
MPTSALADRFRRVCRQTPDAIAVRALVGDDALTFSDLAAASGTIVRALTDAGVGRGAAVVLRMETARHFPRFLACMELGAALVPLGEATDAETTALIREARAVAVITDRALPLRTAQARPCSPDFSS